ncbi:hypothetical protein LUZ63_012514 [Rhynchospora breviuscula]|uniref:Uncharacterized protein n=1 Tax=Rhynchospora breviuscula TaxID=2022672 RepID=A0A9Q0HRG6_9POAL|nr:hypothetical protein LUZ63_012514 [Rhynchospora breviuscula]
MNVYRDHEFGCHLHPQEMVVGVCALCLRERLLILASNQSEVSLKRDKERSFRVSRRKNSIILPKVFALSSFLTRLDSRRHQPNDYADENSIGSFEDSFISIKFEDNGKASWDNNKVINTKPSTMEKETKESKSVVEHTKRGGMLRWRRHIGRLLQLSRWKRSSKAGSCHSGINGKVDSVKGRRGWMKSLTKRRATSVD